MKSLLHSTKKSDWKMNLVTLLIINTIIALCLLASFRYRVVKIPFIGSIDVDVEKASVVRQLVTANILVILFVSLT